jgi:hypothetical protein
VIENMSTDARPLLLVTTAHPCLYEHPGPDGEPVHPHLGRLVQPRHYSSIEATGADGVPWGADNDCFQGLTDAQYYAMLDRLTGIPGCKFVTVPDQVGNARQTAHMFNIWAPGLTRRGLPVALVLQDGIDEPAVARWLMCTWHRLDAVFIGGTDAFKLGPVAFELARRARRDGKWVHWGRVNGRERMRYCWSTGACDSMDGSSWAIFRKTLLDEGLAWCAALAHEPRRPLGWQLGLDLARPAPA